MHIFNEYIHEHAKHQLSTEEWLITYEPPDHVPSRFMTGFIYKGNVDPDAGNISFQLRNTDPWRSCRLTINSNEVDRGFLWDDGAIEMIWKEDPGEHFLCISYRTKESDTTYRDQNKNWLQEGF